MAQASSFFGGLLQGFAQGSERKRQEDQEKKERAAKTKLYEIQLEREQAQLKAEAAQRDALGELLKKIGGNATSSSSAPQDGVGPVRGATQGMSLTELLADPQNAMLLLQSGLGKVKDLTDLQGQTQNQALLKQLMGGAIDESGAAGGAPRGPAAPGGFEVSGFKLDSSGNPMLDFARREVKRWLPSPDGRSVIGVDAMGQPMVSQPAGPGDRAPEDVPLTPDKLSELRTPDGKMLPPGTTLRQAQQMGASTSPKPAEADKKAMVLLRGMQDSELTISGLKGADTSSIINAALSKTPVAQIFTSQDFKKYEAAGKRWAQNYLYLKSGAQASEKEVETTFKTFFPQPGDSDQVKAQKKAARLQEAQNVTAVYNNQGVGNQGASKVKDFSELPD